MFKKKHFLINRTKTVDLFLSDYPTGWSWSLAGIHTTGNDLWQIRTPDWWQSFLIAIT